MSASSPAALALLLLPLPAVANLDRESVEPPAALEARRLSLDGEPGWERLWELALDKDARVRAAVASRLGREPGRRPVLPLAKLLREDPSPEVRRAAAAALARARTPEATIALGRAARWDADPETRLQAVRSLREAGAARAAPDLAKALADADLRVRGEAAMTLIALEDPAHRPALEAALAREKDAGLKALLAEGVARLPAAR